MADRNERWRARAAATTAVLTMEPRTASSVRAGCSGAGRELERAGTLEVVRRALRRRT
jgi:hypothetical protein